MHQHISTWYRLLDHGAFAPQPWTYAGRCEKKYRGSYLAVTENGWTWGIHPYIYIYIHNSLRFKERFSSGFWAFPIILLLTEGSRFGERCGASQASRLSSFVDSENVRGYLPWGYLWIMLRTFHYKPSTYILGHLHFRKLQILVIFGEYPAIRGLCQLYLLILGQDQSSIVFPHQLMSSGDVLTRARSLAWTVRRWMVLRETCWRLTEFHGFPCFSPFLKITFYRFLFWLGSASCEPADLSTFLPDPKIFPTTISHRIGWFWWFWWQKPWVSALDFPLISLFHQSIFHQVAKAQKQLHKLHQSSVGRELSEVPTSTYRRFLQNFWGRENHRSFEYFRGIYTYYICLRINNIDIYIYICYDYIIL